MNWKFSKESHHKVRQLNEEVGNNKWRKTTDVESKRNAKCTGGGLLPSVASRLHSSMQWAAAVWMADFKSNRARFILPNKLASGWPANTVVAKICEDAPKHVSSTETEVGKKSLLRKRDGRSQNIFNTLSSQTENGPEREEDEPACSRVFTSRFDLEIQQLE